MRLYINFKPICYILFLFLFNWFSQCVPTKISDALSHPSLGPDLTRGPCTDFNAGSGSDQQLLQVIGLMLPFCFVEQVPLDRWYSQDGGATWSYLDPGGIFVTTGKAPAAGSCGVGSPPSFSASSSGTTVCLNGSVSTIVLQH